MDSGALSDGSIHSLTEQGPVQFGERTTWGPNRIAKSVRDNETFAFVARN